MHILPISLWINDQRPTVAKQRLNGVANTIGSFSMTRSRSQKMTAPSIAIRWSKLRDVLTLSSLNHLFTGAFDTSASSGTSAWSQEMFYLALQPCCVIVIFPAGVRKGRKCAGEQPDKVTSKLWNGRM